MGICRLTSYRGYSYLNVSPIQAPSVHGPSWRWMDSLSSLAELLQLATSSEALDPTHFPSEPTEENKAKAKSVIAEYDDNNDGKMSFAEFDHWIQKTGGHNLVPDSSR